jgi:hypothetical protein
MPKSSNTDALTINFYSIDDPIWLQDKLPNVITIKFRHFLAFERELAQFLRFCQQILTDTTRRIRVS